MTPIMSGAAWLGWQALLVSILAVVFLTAHGLPMHAQARVLLVSSNKNL